jgi:vacuolar-type H+-ATPase subunit F/Vma7
MTAPVYVGDEVTAAGFRLAGVRVLVPEDGNEDAALARARADASIVIVCASVAARLRPQSLRAALVSASPPCVVLRDLHGEFERPDIAARICSQLGIEV